MSLLSLSLITFRKLLNSSVHTSLIIYCEAVHMQFVTLLKCFLKLKRIWEFNLIIRRHKLFALHLIL